MKKNRCDECGEILEKTFVIDTFNQIPMYVWVCPKSEIYQLYKREFERRYSKHVNDN